MDLQKYTALFLQETREYVAGLGKHLVELERDPSNRQLLDELLRLSHSTKGLSAAMGYASTADLFHALEDVFVAARKGTFTVSKELMTLCLSALDRAEASFASIGKQQKELPCGDAATALRAALVNSGNDATATSSPAGNPADQEQLSTPAVDFIRVGKDIVDALTNLAGEFALFSGRLRAAAPASLTSQCEQLEKLVADLTFYAGEIRLVPLEQAFARFPRLVRDVSQAQHKEIRLEMAGTDVELDKTLVDHLASPLIHLLRNAVDHGIELPDERATKGKPREGVIRLTVERAQGFARVSVEDDGAPIDVAALKKIALAKGFTEQQLASISGENILDLLTLPGFSSATTVTDISGRGVGLSAVRESAKALGGQLTLTHDARGKRFTLSLPLELSIIPSVVVEVSGEAYAIPMVHIRRLLRLSSREIVSALGAPTALVDGSDVPLLDLRILLGSGDAPGPTASTPADDAAPQEISIVLTESDRGTVGLIVNHVEGKMDLPVKPIPKAMQSVPFFTGSTILASGRVALILDAGSLAREQARRWSSPVSHR